MRAAKRLLIGDPRQCIERFAESVDPSVLKLAEAIGRRLAEQVFAKLYGDKP